MFKKFLLLGLVLLPFSAIADDIEADKISLRGVDKITGRVSTMNLNVGETISFGKLQITAQKCLTKPIEEAPENTAYLNITEGKGGKTLFKGWMFSSNPALSAMEDPVYDIWVLSCSKTESTTHAPTTIVKPDVEPVHVQELESIDLMDDGSDFVVMEELKTAEPDDDVLPPDIEVLD